MDNTERNKGFSAIVRKFPVGPVSMVSPFNFPCASPIVIGHTRAATMHGRAACMHCQLCRHSGRALHQVFFVGCALLGASMTLVVLTVHWCETCAG